MSICPLCNNLKQMHINCPYCDTEMVDTGAVFTYYDPYSPYLDEELYIASGDLYANYCIHLFTCPKCGYDHRYLIQCIES